MEVSNEIKEDIRKTQSDLKNAIRIHQVDNVTYYIILTCFKLLFILINSYFLDLGCAPSRR